MHTCKVTPFQWRVSHILVRAAEAIYSQLQTSYGCTTREVGTMYTNKHHGNNIQGFHSAWDAWGVSDQDVPENSVRSNLSSCSSCVSSLLSKRERHPIVLNLQAHLGLQPHIQVDVVWNKLGVSLSRTMLLLH